ncbi:MAG: leucine-rich repeat protein [Bacteroidia bacterium]
MLIAAILYLYYYVSKIPQDLYYLKWIITTVVIFAIISVYFFTLRPALKAKKELDFRPTGIPDGQYFTTTPRIDDKYNFFVAGYEQYVEWLRQSRAPVLYLTGPSGAGKSSLIRAYLIPQLEKQKQQKTRVYFLRSYHDPLNILYEKLKNEENTKTAINAETVNDLINEASKMLFPDERILIVLDQFEEFFLIRNQSEASKPSKGIEEIKELEIFFNNFIKNPPKGIQILLSYRDDFQQLIDQLHLPARIEHINFKEVKLFTFKQASKFLKSCPGLDIPDLQLNRILKEAASIDSPITLRPIVLNLLGIILQQMISKEYPLKQKGNLIKQYILQSLGKELRMERATIIKGMLTDFNTAKPRTISQLSKNSSLTISQLDNQMMIMQHHGLVRCLDSMEISQGNRKWQIAHDFIALQLEKVVYGISKTLLQKTTPWIAPGLICVLLLFSASYYTNIDNWEKTKAIKEINRAGLLWNEQTKTISSSDIQLLSDSLFQSLVPSFFALQPDTLKINFDYYDTIHQMSKLDKINTLKSLKCISISNSSRITNLDDLRGFSTLEKLSLTYCLSLKNVNGLEDLTHLSSLYLEDCGEIQNFDPIKKLSLLSKLQIKQREIKNINFLRNLTSLTNLTLYNCENLKDLTTLRRLGSLTDLELYFAEHLESLDGLDELINLNHLELLGCKKLSNIDGLKRLKQLTNLHLAYSDELQNIDNLQELNALSTLSLMACLKLQNINALKALKALNSLDLRQCTNLQNIDVLMNLPNLKTIYLGGNPQIPVLQIENLKLVLPNAKISY